MIEVKYGFKVLDLSKPAVKVEVNDRPPCVGTPLLEKIIVGFCFAVVAASAGHGNYTPLATMVAAFFFTLLTLRR